MRVRSFAVEPADEVVVKVHREALDLCGISVGEESADFDELSVSHVFSDGMPFSVSTTMLLVRSDGTTERHRTERTARAGENTRAERHRLVKLNFYELLRKRFDIPPAPWGILYGVRPSKIVHRCLNDGQSRDEVVARLMEDYRVSGEKAALLVDSSIYQRPFLATARSDLVSVYVGIPFCLSRCLYCSFPSFVLPKPKTLDRFMEVFFRDLEAVREAVERYRFRVQNIYVGGGTPTSLPDEYFAAVMERICEAFRSEALVEFSVEAGRPDSMTHAKLDTMLRCRVNRVSVNPQTMQERTLRRIGRNHTPEDILRMYADLREAGNFCINMDVIVGLPGEDEADMSDTMEKLEALRPDDLTLHALALKKGSLLKMNLAETEMPDDGTVRRMFDIAMGAAREMGLVPYYLYRQGYQSGQLENVGCCRPGAESMYNIQIMEEHQTILGIGGAATSKIVNPTTLRLKSSFNPKEITIYLDKVDEYIEKRARLLAEAYGRL